MKQNAAHGANLKREAPNVTSNTLTNSVSYRIQNAFCMIMIYLTDTKELNAIEYKHNEARAHADRSDLLADWFKLKRRLVSRERRRIKKQFNEKTTINSVLQHGTGKITNRFWFTDTGALLNLQSYLGVSVENPIQANDPEVVRRSSLNRHSTIAGARVAVFFERADDWIEELGIDCSTLAAGGNTVYLQPETFESYRQMIAYGWRPSTCFTVVYVDLYRWSGDRFSIGITKKIDMGKLHAINKGDFVTP